jgi:uncharacterized protein YqgC (DUF456 family)
MTWMLYLILLLTAVVGWFLLLLLMPGLFLMTAASAAYALLTRGHYISWRALLVLLALSLAAELIELFLGKAVIRRAGGGSAALTGATIGGIAGGIFLTFIPIPILGTLVGVCLGTFIGAFAVELIGGTTHGGSIGVGLGAVKGRLGGIVAKLAIGA